MRGKGRGRGIYTALSARDIARHYPPVLPTVLQIITGAEKDLNTSCGLKGGEGWKFLAEFRLLVQRPSFTTDRIFFPFFFRIGRKRIGGIRMEGIRRWFREGDISSPEGKFEKVGSQIFEFGIFESIHAASSRSTLFPWLLSVGNANV